MAKRKKPKHKLAQRSNVVKKLKIIVNNQEILKKLSSH